MAKLGWTPWHKVVQVREDLKSGELSLAVFAADIYDVAMGKGSKIYLDPKEFFALTYPTFNLRELSKDVMLRLAGKSDKAVRQLELTYGGGKTHTLITLYHLANKPDQLPDLPAVSQFIEHIGISPQKARIVVLPFDKLDVEKGMNVCGPKGETRWLKHPWSVMAFQIAGDDGLKILHAEGKTEERESAPAENLLVDLLSLPGKEKLSTLILIDEVLMYAREKIGFDPTWRGRLLNFFQYLTQAATKISSCAIVASLLATDPMKSDTLGKEITHELYAVFRREREEGVQPVLKEDVAEVLRRRFFTPESILDHSAFRSHVVAALKGINDLDDQLRKEGRAAEERFLDNYPFHPDLTDVFYSKWTNLEGFQRTRGVLRTFALAIRDAEQWDQSPLIGANVFIGAPDKTGLSEAARELANIAATEDYEGKKQEWTGVLDGELGKAREIGYEWTGLRHRELEQAVFATFLHSQPIGQKASTRELLLLLGSTRPDGIELKKGLRRWAEISWFLDEEAMQEIATLDSGQVPKTWRLGSRPNLKQMHHDSCLRISPELIEVKLEEEIKRQKRLIEGASAAGASVHMLPKQPREIEDDGEFRFAILGPACASDAGKPNSLARRFIEETTASDKPRVNKNAVILSVPSRDGLEQIRNAIKESIAWEDVRAQLVKQQLDPIREQTLAVSVDKAKKKIPQAIQSAYCIFITITEKKEIEAFRIAPGDEPLFSVIKADRRSRIQETAINAEAILPGGPYDLWRENEPSRRVKDLVGAFAERPWLPKMLSKKAIFETISNGCMEGLFVLRLTRPDRSIKTFWREKPDDIVVKDSNLEVVLPESVILTDLAPSLLVAGELPGLWNSTELSFHDMIAYFAGGKKVKVERGGYEESVVIPKADRSILEVAVRNCVQEGNLWLISGTVSLLGEDIPAGILTDDSSLLLPPSPVQINDILPENLPDAWRETTTTALAIAVALSKKAGKPLPWVTVKNAIDASLRMRIIQRSEDSGQWPSDYSTAQNIKLALPLEAPSAHVSPVSSLRGNFAAEAYLRPNEVQDFADRISEIVKTAAGMDLKFRMCVELHSKAELSQDIVARLNTLLQDVSNDLILRNK